MIKWIQNQISRILSLLIYEILIQILVQFNAVFYFCLIRFFWFFSWAFNFYFQSLILSRYFQILKQVFFFVVFLNFIDYFLSVYKWLARIKRVQNGFLAFKFLFFNCKHLWNIYSFSLTRIIIKWISKKSKELQEDFSWTQNLLYTFIVFVIKHIVIKRTKILVILIFF